MLRNTQQQLVALSGQADLKASLLTTAAAVAASIAAAQIGDPDIGWAAGTLLVFLLAALLASVLAVFPKFQVHREPEGELPPHFNPLFFGHYARIPKQRYLAEMLRVVSDDSALYLDDHLGPLRPGRLSRHSEVLLLAPQLHALLGRVCLGWSRVGRLDRRPLT